MLLVGHMGMYDYRPYVRRVANNKQILFECDRGYHITRGPPGATCVDGQWSPAELPHCERFYYPQLLRWNRSVRPGKCPLPLRPLTPLPETGLARVARRKRHQQKHKCKPDSPHTSQANPPCQPPV